MTKVFSKEKWLESATADLNKGILRQRDIDNAIRVWVDKYDGKTREELGMRSINANESKARDIGKINYANDWLRDEWFITIE